MANGDDDTSRPRPVTAGNVWEAFDRFSADIGQRFDRFTAENREARHSSANQTARVVMEEGKETRDLIGQLEARVRLIETSVPSSLGGRMGETEQWRAVIQAADLPHRVDKIESTLDKFGGTLTSIKVLGTIIGLLNAAVILWATVMGGRSVVP